MLEQFVLRSNLYSAKYVSSHVNLIVSEHREKFGVILLEVPVISSRLPLDGVYCVRSSWHVGIGTRLCAVGFFC